MSYSDLKFKTNGSLDKIIKENNIFRENMMHQENSFINLQTNIQAEYNERVINHNEKVSNLQNTISENLTQQASDIKQAFTNFNAKIAENNIEELVENMRKEHLAAKKEDLSDIEENHVKIRKENTYKINALEREYKAKHRDYLIEVEELEKSLKHRVNEINRKLEFDIKKEKDQSIRDCSPFNKELLLVNEPIQIKAIKNEINRIRAEHIETVYTMQVNALDEIEEIKVSTKTKIFQAEEKIKKFREELNIRIAELEENIKISELSRQLSDDLYELDFLEKVIHTTKDTNLKLNELKRDYLLETLKLKKLTLESNLQNELNMSLLSYENLATITTAIEQEEAQLLSFNEAHLTTHIENNKKTSEFFMFQVNILVAFLNRYIHDSQDLLTKNQNLIFGGTLLNNLPNVEGEIYDYEYNYRRFEKNINDFYSEHEQRVNKFTSSLDKLITQFNDLSQKMINTIIEFIEESIHASNKLFSELFTHNEEVLKQAEAAYEAKRANIEAHYNNQFVDLEAENEKIENDFSTENKVIIANFNNDILKHTERVKEVEQKHKNDLNETRKETQALVKEINQKMSRITKTTKDNITKATIKARNIKDVEHYNYLKDKKAKLKLL